MLMSLGLFVFSLNTAPFSKLNRQTKESWGKSGRFAMRPATQHIGPGDDTLKIEGTIAPSLTGSPQNLDILRDMMAKGDPWLLASGRGTILGMWFIETIDEIRSYFTDDGQPRLIEFSITLQRYGEERPDQLGDLAR